MSLDETAGHAIGQNERGTHAWHVVNCRVVRGPLFGACVYARRPLWLHMRRLRDCIASCMDFGFGTEVSVA